MYNYVLRITKSDRPFLTFFQYVQIRNFLQNKQSPVDIFGLLKKYELTLDQLVKQISLVLTIPALMANVKRQSNIYEDEWEKDISMNTPVLVYIMD